MADACAKCLMTFPRHLVVRARCSKRWRGHNFDQAAAEGNVGAGVADVLGMRVKTTPELTAFLKRCFVRAYGEGLDPNPAAEFDPAVGERFEFHVGLREPVDDATWARIEAAARDAVARSRNFSPS